MEKGFRLKTAAGLLGTKSHFPEAQVLFQAEDDF